MCCDLKLQQPALLGGPLSLTATVGTTASQAREFILRFASPRVLGHRCAGSLDLSRSSADESQACGYSEHLTQAVFRLRGSGRSLGWPGPWSRWMPGQECASVEWALRDLELGSPGRLPSVELQQARLRSFKTCIRYSASWSSVPEGQTEGVQLRADVEASMPPGDVRFLKGEVQAQGAWPLFRFWRGGSWQMMGHLSASCGMLLPMDGLPSCPQDRFYLGGAAGTLASGILKGFQHRGAGPSGVCQPNQPNQPQRTEQTDNSSAAGGARPDARADRKETSGKASGSQDKRRLLDSLGGDALINTFAAVSVPLPASVSLGALPMEGRMMLFLGAGALAPRTGALRAVGSTRAAAGQGEQGWQALRVSAGAGLALPLAGMGTLELAFAQPLLAQRTDALQSWQLGLRLQLNVCSCDAQPAASRQSSMLYALIDAKVLLDELDSKVGDADCGSTMAKAATLVLEEKARLPLADPKALCGCLSDILGKSMGGSSGVLLSIMFMGMASYFDKEGKKQGWKEAGPKALMKGLEDMMAAGGAKPGMRTMLDSLVPAAEALIEGKGLAGAVTAAEVGVESTKTMKPGAGRSENVPDSVLNGNADPGAKAVALFLSAVAK
ncbi:unnamed protein product [Polarella glacialis]|uniref:DhaL domain-containing protein n=1 Tax=Polarella glacialis TaxID=89957 RepID=A0A813JIE3_POLGL|nr:unnamed protein product [Polarella glacialis]